MELLILRVIFIGSLNPIVKPIFIFWKSLSKVLKVWNAKIICVAIYPALRSLPIELHKLICSFKIPLNLSFFVPIFAESDENLKWVGFFSRQVSIF